VVLSQLGTTSIHPTLPQGYCCDMRCPNTPQAWQLGWISVQQADASTLRFGAPLQLKLASQATTQASGLRVDVNSWLPGEDALFLGYRTAERGDKTLSPGLAGQLHIYSAPIANTYDSRQTLWHAGLTGESGSCFCCEGDEQARPTSHLSCNLVVMSRALRLSW
jgi:hypothetical protein